MASRVEISTTLAFAEDRRYADRGYAFDTTRRIHSIRKGRFKLIRYPGHGRDFFELYDLEEDPRETRNIAAERPELRVRLTEDLDAWYDGSHENPAPAPSEREREGLRSLGYLPE